MNLLDNGLDSLKKCIQNLNEIDGFTGTKNDYNFRLKDIIIAFHHSIETIFKYLIVKKNEYLLYQSLDKIMKNKVELKINPKQKTLEQNTIQFIDGINYVIVLYNLDIDSLIYTKLKLLNEKRNALTHYTLDFIDYEIEHIIASLLPYLFKIYKDNIGEFEEYAKKNQLYKDTHKILGDMEIWLLKRNIIYSKKWGLAKSKMGELDKQPERKEPIFKLRTDKTFNYVYCPCCGNELFQVHGSYIIDSENIKSLGKCLYCGLEVDSKDCQMAVLLYNGDYESASMNENEMVEELIEILLSPYESHLEEYNDLVSSYKEKIKELYRNNSDRIDHKLKVKLGYLVDDICSFLANYYFKKNIYYFNDVTEKLIKEKESKIELIFSEHPIPFDEASLKKAAIIENTMNKINLLEKTLFEKIKESLSKQYLSYQNAMYINWDGQENEAEITILVSFEYPDLNLLHRQRWEKMMF